MGWMEQAAREPVEKISEKIRGEWTYYDKAAITKTAGIKMAVIGREKVGKSIFSASASLVEKWTDSVVGPKIPPGVVTSIIDTENAASWLPRFYKKQFKAKKVRVCPVYVENDEKEVDPCKSFELFWDTLVELADEKEGTIVIDSLSDVYSWVNSYLRLEVLKLGPKKTGFQADVRPSDWYWRNDKWESLMKLIRRVHCNVIVTAKVKEVWDVLPTDTGKQRLQKTGAYAPVWHYSTGYWLDLILEMNIKYVGGVATRYGTVRGSRAGLNFNEEIVKPSFGKILDRIAVIEPTLDF